MDGVAPTLFNTYNGRWTFFVEQSYQWRNERSGQELRGAKFALMSRIGTALGDPGIIRDLDRGFRLAWGSVLTKGLTPVVQRPRESAAATVVRQMSEGLRAGACVQSPTAQAAYGRRVTSSAPMRPVPHAFP